MTHTTNVFGQPIGLPVTFPLPCPEPDMIPLVGQYGTLNALAPDHADGLYSALCKPGTDNNWTYLPEAPWRSLSEAQASCVQKAASRDPRFYTICTPDGVPQGHASYLRLTPAAGVIEVGFIHFGADMQQTPLATEAMFLMMQHVFEDLGYRRYEWKCDALNAPSRRAAARLGFTYEGTFRQATTYKGRNRDTAWFSILDTEWPDQKRRFQSWLSANNFDPAGRQKSALVQR